MAFTSGLWDTKPSSGGGLWGNSNPFGIKNIPSVASVLTKKLPKIGPYKRSTPKKKVVKKKVTPKTSRVTNSTRTGTVKAGAAKPKPKKTTASAVPAPATAGALQFVPDVNRAKAAQNAVRSAMADRGMLNSTMYGSAAGEAAATDARNQFLEQEAIRQYNVNQAMRAYEMLTAKTLQEAQIRGGFEGLSSQYPNQPTYWSYLQQYMPPEYKPTAAHTGDPTGPANQPWTGFTPAGGKTLGGKQLDASIAEANARIALQRRQVDIAAEQWKMQKAAMEKAASDDTTWQAMADAAATNYQWVDDGTGTGGMKKIGSMTPEAMINAFRAKYGVDVERIATDPSNPNMDRARAIYKILYYKTGQKRLDLFDQGVPWDQARTLDIRGNYVGKPTTSTTTGPVTGLEGRFNEINFFDQPSFKTAAGKPTNSIIELLWRGGGWNPEYTSKAKSFFAGQSAARGFTPKK